MSNVHFFCVLCGSALQSSSEALYDLIQCQACSRHVPVPRPLTGPGNLSTYPPVLPPDVLELLLTFQCTSCHTVIQADARYEGRHAACPKCEAETPIPRWSLLPGQPLGRRPTIPLRPLAATAQLPSLTLEEIDFLRGTETGKPEAVA